LYREFFLERYQKVADHLRTKGVGHIMVDSDGNILALLDLMIEAGIDGIWPLEVNAGMNVAELSKKWGDRMWFSGNIDKHEAAQGGGRMRKEVDKKVGLAEDLGGYCPGLDHLVHVEFTYETFQEYAAYMRERLGY
jgi:uroporphyrinogen decarboxylase